MSLRLDTESSSPSSGRFPYVSLDQFPGEQTGLANTAGYSFPAIAENIVFLNQAGEHGVLAFDLTTGTQKWAFSPPNKVTFGGTPLYLNGVLSTVNSRV